MKWKHLEEAIEIARIGAGKEGFQSYPGTGSIWAGQHDGFADINCTDWGLARAIAIILNATLDGTLSLPSAHQGGDQ